MKTDSLFGTRRMVALGVAAALGCAATAMADAPAFRPAAGTHDLAPLKQVDAVGIAPLNLQALRLEDDQRAAVGQPPRFAVPHEVTMHTDNAGTWENLDDETLVWRLRIESPGAVSINLGFLDYWMPEGAQLTIYATDMAYVVRPFTNKDNAEHGQLWTPAVPGDDIMVELVVPAKVVDQVGLELGSINIGYRGFHAALEATGRDGTRSGSCNLDVVCGAADGFPEVDNWRDIIQSVAVYSTGGSTFCTGFMVNNARNDLTPYFMTADHCGIGAGNAPSLVTYWNFQNSTCRAPGSAASGGAGDGVLSQFISGSTFRAGYSTSDMTLVELSADPDPAWEVAYAGWDRSGVDATNAIAVHHPNTDEKRISFEDDPTTITSYLQASGGTTHVRVEDWDLGTTEPGSSGSPLFDQNGRVIGQLHGGFAACGNDDADWYGRFFLSWTGGGTSSSRLSDWLDPDGTGAVTVNTISGAGLNVDPGTDTVHQGLTGGPFSPASTVYTLTNNGADPVNYEVSIVPGGNAPVLLDGGSSPVSGTLAASGGSTTVTVSVDQVAAAGLSAGSYSTDIAFEDQTNARTTTTTHAIEAGLTGIEVTPLDDLFGSGPLGGPFGPNKMYVVTSTQPSPVDVSVSASDNWIALDGGTSAVNFTLSGVGDSRVVDVDFSANANALPVGFYTGTVFFTNTTDGTGDTSRGVLLDLGRLVRPSTDTPLPISDNTTFESKLTVSDSVCVADLDVDLDISHTFIGDLIVELTSPVGTTVRLHNRSGSSADDIVQTYDDGTNPPDGPGTLADFNGEIAAGTWTLTVSDNAGADTGTLNSWALLIGSGAGGCPPVAGDIETEVPQNATTSLILDGTSVNGGSLDYTILSLPTNGTLTDPLGGTINAVPYTLLGNGDAVNYTPATDYIGPDSLTYRCNDGQNSNTATVDISVGTQVTAYSFPLDSDPGWTTEGQWAWGMPTGAEDDPSGGATGDNCYGYNLDGDYANNIPEYTLTMPALDLSDYTNVQLKFWRWLGVESSSFDQAALEMSTDGSTYSTVWAHSGSSFQDTAWTQVTFDLPAASQQPTVYLRWVMGTTDGSVTYSGWHIDDISVTGVSLAPPIQCPGDVNGDNDTNLNDFTDLASNFGAAGLPHGAGESRNLGDLNDDGNVNLDDFTILSMDFGCEG
ncbi:MAG: proprotein convertase P-domain-containing protein [Planctomycetota bacterium]